MTLPLSLGLWKPLKIIKEATSSVNIVTGILWVGSPGSGLDGHSNITATVESQFSGICAKAGSPILDISAVAGPQFFFSLRAANVPSTKSITAPPQTHISGSLTHNASPAARVFLKGKVNTQWHLKITTYSGDSWNGRKILHSKARIVHLFVLLNFQISGGGVSWVSGGKAYNMYCYFDVTGLNPASHSCHLFSSNVPSNTITKHHKNYIS